MNDLRARLTLFGFHNISMKLAVKYGIPSQCIATIMKSNLDDMSNIAKLVLEDIGVGLLKFDVLAEIGRAKSELKTELLNEKDIFIFRDKAIELARAYPEKVYAFLPWVLTTVKSLRVTRGLCGFRNLISILPDGGISLCGLGFTHPETIMGNIQNSSISEIWQKKDTMLSQIRNWTPDNYEGVCKKCIFRKYCANLCPALVYDTYGSFKKSFPICQNLYDKNSFPEQFLIED